MIRKDNGSNNSLFLNCQMGLSDGAFFVIKHTPLPNENHPILSPVCPIADTLEHRNINEKKDDKFSEHDFCVFCTHTELPFSSNNFTIWFVSFQSSISMYVIFYENSKMLRSNRYGSIMKPWNITSKVKGAIFSFHDLLVLFAKIQSIFQSGHNWNLQNQSYLHENYF